MFDVSFLEGVLASLDGALGWLCPVSVQVGWFLPGGLTTASGLSSL